MMSPRERLIVALDVSSAMDAQKIVRLLGDSVQTYKVGMQLFTAEGPPIVRDLVASGKHVFLDLKYHDIPNTVAAAVCAAAQLGVSMLTVHASGGSRMLKAAAEAAQNAHSPLQLLAVTVLTSMREADLIESGVQAGIQEHALRLASTALDAGCAGVVSSVKEVQILRRKFGNDFLVVTPGVRPAGAEHGDQARVATPAEAIKAGATHIVVGRPITAAENPGAVAENILKEIA